MAQNAIYISIKPKYTKLIESGKKDYEFRSYIPKTKITTLYVYETSPVCKLTYIIEIGNIVKNPDQINENGIGNQEFNKGTFKYRYAYYIKKLYKLNNSISLNKLRNFGFTPPQAYAYGTTYAELTKFLKNQPKTIIIDRGV